MKNNNQLLPKRNRIQNQEDFENLTTPFFTAEEIRYSAKDIKTYKAPGLDGVSHVIKIIAQENKDYLVGVINEIIKTGNISERVKGH